MKRALVILFVSFSVICLHAQTGKVGSVTSVKNRQITVKNDNVNSPFQIGDKLHVDADGSNIVLEVTFPMQTVSNCKVVSGSAAKLRPGMKVYSGEISAPIR